MPSSDWSKWPGMPPRKDGMEVKGSEGDEMLFSEASGSSEGMMVGSV